jgi:hypothetical protein
LADLLERVLDKGIVIAGDITIKLVQVELLTIQLRLVICSVDKAKEMGMDWWVNHPAFGPQTRRELPGRLEQLEQRMAAMEAVRQAPAVPGAVPAAALLEPRPLAAVDAVRPVSGGG